MAKEKIVAPSIELQEVIAKYQLSVVQFAKDLKLSASGARQLISGKSKISIQTGLRLAKYFNTAEDYWINLQIKFDLAETKKDAEFSEIVKCIPKAKVPTTKKPEKAPADGKKEKKPKK
jgi:addiction module HigA family antidote